METTEPADAAPDRLRELPSRLLGLASMFADKLSHERLAAVGARRWHYAVLVALVDRGPGSQSTLSRRTGIYRSDLVAVLNELEEQGHVERAPDPDDRRRNVITVTERGAAHTRELERLLHEMHEELLAPLSGKDRTQLVGLLTRVVDHQLASGTGHPRTNGD